jgi:two-component system, NtrC family, sensor histidine kinase PilS
VDAIALNAPAAARDTSADSLWGSLHYFNLYRLTVACLFAFASFYVEQPGLFGMQDPDMTQWVSLTYLGAALIFLAPPFYFRRSFDVLLTVEVAVDVLALTLLMYANGGNRSGIGYMLLVVLAGAGLVGQGRLVLFYAAMATVAVLLEQGYRMLSGGAELADFTHTGIISIGFFATAASARLLARRVVTNEELARQRGVELDEQLDINQRVIRDMQDGVLVVDAIGRVRQHNPQAELLCDVTPGEAPLLGDFSADLAYGYAMWRRAGVEAVEIVRLPSSNRMLRVRFLPPVGEGDNALIYLEDMERIQAQARQIKLAALGRLTANMAHEIRNPLASISHASELLAEERDDHTQQRLVRIIGDNTQRLNRLVTDVLELGGRDKAQPERVLAAQLLADFIEEMSLLEPKARRIIRIDVDPQRTIWFDRGHLNRILVNLVGNALRYCSGDSGSIRVELRESTSARVELDVIDDGPGIGPEERTHMFEPFFTTRSSGTGLGLYIARELCEANDAMIDFLETERGCHFRIVARDDA